MLECYQYDAGKKPIKRAENSILCAKKIKGGDLLKQRALSKTSAKSFYYPYPKNEH